MPVIRETKKLNAKVAQLKRMLSDNVIKKDCDAQWIFDKITTINDAIVHTNYLQQNHKEWIGCTILHFAAMERDSDAFEVLLNSGADFTKKNCQDSTALHVIIQQEVTSISEECTLNDSFVNLVLSAHLKNSNYENPLHDSGLSHFHIACAADNVDVVEGFLSSGVPVNHNVKTDSFLFPGFISLHFAARFCAFDVLDVLLSHGADVHAKDAKGFTPLHLALKQKLKIMSASNVNGALRDKNERILELLSAKANNNGGIFRDGLGLSQLHVACTFKESKMAECLLQKVADINQPVNMDSPLSPGYTALHFAALCIIDTVKLLLKKGADISIKDAKGVTPFDICIERYKAEDIYAVISLNPVWKNIMLSDGKTKLTDLVFAMRNPNQFNVFLKKISKNFSIFNSPLWPGCTPMHLAVTFSSKISKNSEQTDTDVNLQIMMNLLEQNPGMLHTSDVEHRTPLHLAFRLNKKPMLDLIFNYLESYADVTDRVDKEGLSYLHIATATNKISPLERLLTTNVNVNMVYEGNSLVSPRIYPGLTPLHFAVVNGSTEAVDALLKRGANVYARDVNGMTPIHLILSSDQKKLADILLNSPNLNDSIANGTGLSHLHVACRWNKYGVVKRLLDAGADVNRIVNYRNEEPNQMNFLEKYAGYSPLLFNYSNVVQHTQNDRLATMQLLLQRDADIFVENAKGTPLLYEVFEEINTNLHDIFVETLEANDALQARLEADTGMTKLHVACLVMDVNAIERLIKEKADVNAQIRFDAPIFQGYAPLHVVMHACEVNVDEETEFRAIELLVGAGADVMLQSMKSGTAVHMAYKLFTDERGELQYNRVNMLLKAQRDFSVNPTKDGDLSHFHIACSVCNVGIVDKFLIRGEIDVNQPIDYFYEIEAGYSPLHLAASSQSVLCEAWKQLHTIDLLLKNGADVHHEDRYGDTPLHESARYNSLDLFERLVRGGADVNAENICGDTPLGCFLESRSVSAEKIRILLRYGCHINAFNPVDKRGYLGLAVRRLPYKDMHDLLTAINVNFEQEMEIDDDYRTVIHNIVSVGTPPISTREYADLIEKLTKEGCDVDNKDYLGRTALHVTVEFPNSKATAALLMAGADINISDIDNRTALACYFDMYPICDTRNRSIDEAAAEPCIHEILAVHIKKLQMCGLDVTEQNEDIAGKVFEQLENKITLSQEFFKELEDIKSIRIASPAVTLHEFLSETGIVADYPIMSMFKRDAINEFFSPNELQSFRIKFPETAGILQLQYRKARARPELVELAKNALATLVGFRLPEICSCIILVLLKNSELKNLFRSTN